MRIIYTEKELKQLIKQELDWRDKMSSFNSGLFIGALAGAGIMLIVFLIKWSFTNDDNP